MGVDLRLGTRIANFMHNLQFVLSLQLLMTSCQAS